MDGSVERKQGLSSKDLLAGAIKRRQAILFVGAGVSMAVGLPSWKTLVDHLLKELQLGPEVIDGMNDGYQMLAEFYRLKQGGMGPLRSWLDRNWKVATDKVSQSELHKLIVELDFPAIYTTNYDRNLETAFEIHHKPYAKIANAKHIADAAQDKTHIIKYHGDFDDDASLVLTETDFLDRLSFDSPLWRTWEKSGHKAHRPPSFVFMPSSNPVQEAILAHWGITLITPERGSCRDDVLTTFLADIRAISNVDDLNSIMGICDPAARPCAGP